MHIDGVRWILLHSHVEVYYFSLKKKKLFKNQTCVNQREETEQKEKQKTDSDTWD